MKLDFRKRIVLHAALLMAVLLMMAGVLLMVETFARYNQLALDRQDDHLKKMAHAIDDSMTWQLNNVQRDLEYAVGRRAFAEAEKQWLEQSSTERLEYRMEECLVNGNPIIESMLAMYENEILVSTNGRKDYRFLPGMEEHMVLCCDSEGEIYLALLKDTAALRYVALVDLQNWYNMQSSLYMGNNLLLLLGGDESVLMHTWLGERRVDAVTALNEENCDFRAVQQMLASRHAGSEQMVSYNLQYPGEEKIHEMRMITIPQEQGSNGCFLVSLTSDYDEIIEPMHSSVLQMLSYGCLAGLGVMVLIILSIRLVWEKRHTDRELERLRQRNAETQRLLETTKELAHHQRLETIGTMTSSIAHEFNNLLTPIMGYSILTLEALPEEYGELTDNVAEIYEASRKAKMMISRLNALSRKNAEENDVRLQLDELVDKMLHVAAPAQPSHVNTVVLPCEASCEISGNEMQLSQMLLNLILNAYHAMDKAGGTLTVSFARETDGVVLRIRDTGVGIDQQVLPHIFDAFFTTKETGKGTGLGLAIVRQVADNHHIRIQVESESGRGTVFTLRFPAANILWNNDIT